jgi:hypothetical protein
MYSKEAGVSSLMQVLDTIANMQEAGPMIMYEEGPRQVYVHKLCAEW